MHSKRIDRSRFRPISDWTKTATPFCLAGISLVAMIWSASAQDSKPAGPPANGGNAPTGGTAAPASGGGAPAADGAAAKEKTSSSDSATESALDYLFNRRPEDGSAAAQGSGVASVLGDRAIADDVLGGVGNQIDPEFESFLNSPEQNQELAENYAKMLDETVEHLRERRAYDAIANLYVLGRYTWDARISEQLANRVMALRDARMNQQGLEQDNSALENKIRSANYNADQLADSVRKKEEEFLRREAQRAKNSPQAKQQQQQNQGKNNGAFLPSPEQTQQAVSSVMGRLQLTEEYFRSLDSRARVRLNEKEIEEIEKKARKDFQDFIGVLFEAQRHHHAWLAAEFYRVLFGDGDLPADMASQATASAEIISRIGNDVDVFEFKCDKGQIASGSKILNEAFSLSKHHPALRTIVREEKLEIADYLADLQKVKNMIEARDFGSLDTALGKLETEVTDFDGTKPRALVSAVKRESDMRLGMAKMAAQNGELDKAMEEFRAASQAWPGNPKLEEASTDFFSSQDVMTQSTEDFDKAYAAEDFRLIFDKQLAFAVSVRGDAKREDQLREALETVKAAELALEKAKLLERNRDPFGAWEALELASTDWPDDPALNRRRADLAVRASEFVSSVSKARDAELAGDNGFSLTWFLNAQNRYPASQLANDGIKRLTDRSLGREVIVDEEEDKTESSAKDADAPSSDKPKSGEGEGNTRSTETAAAPTDA